MKNKMGQGALLLGLAAITFLVSACATPGESDRTDRIHENADQSMQRLHNEEMDHGGGY
ncbi:MAG TPA: hypothetical protein VFG95_07865 [Nitrospiria bacterium]|nr:hypothetical protein [Nitrospiria bacterium]